MKIREFRDYLDADGKNEIREWLDRLPVKAKAKINTRILFLEAVTVLTRPHVGNLKHECDGLLELRVQTENVQYRPLACYGPADRQITLLLGAVEKGRKFVPIDACRNALTRKRTIFIEEGRTCIHDIR